MSAWTYLEKITRMPHRGSGTPQEATAARLLAVELQTLGYTVERQHFRAPRKTLYFGPAVIIAVFLIATISLGPERPGLALAVMVISVLPLLGELRGWPINLDLVLPRYRSLNLVASLQEQSPASAAGADGPDRTASERPAVYISAHYDTQFGSHLFAPWFRPCLQAFFTASYVALALLPITLLIRTLFPAAPYVGEVLLGVVTYLLLALAWLLWNGITGEYINGANDNGSGTALALELARRAAAGEYPHLDLVFVFTGSEETGTRGMRHFIRHLASGSHDRQPPVSINLDNVGAGIPRFLEGEGMLGFIPYDSRLLALARTVGAAHGNRVVAKRKPLLPTDGLMAIRAGYPAITFIAMDERGRIPEYHWHTDRIERVDQELMAFWERYLDAYVKELAHNQPAPEP